MSDTSPEKAAILQRLYERAKRLAKLKRQRDYLAHLLKVWPRRPAPPSEPPTG